VLLFVYATLFAVHQQQQKIYEKERERERNNQKTNISKKQHSNYTRNTDASCDETIRKRHHLYIVYTFVALVVGRKST